MSVMPGSVHAMLTGMVIMVLPALLICIGIALMAYRRRDRFTGGKAAGAGRPVSSPTPPRRHS
jgi:hypothetical protein